MAEPNSKLKIIFDVMKKAYSQFNEWLWEGEESYATSPLSCTTTGVFF